jgi:hypothetical protein
MKPRSVIVDVAVDQGGCIATTRETTHEGSDVRRTRRRALRRRQHARGGAAHQHLCAHQRHAPVSARRGGARRDRRSAPRSGDRHGLNTVDGAYANAIVAASLGARPSTHSSRPAEERPTAVSRRPTAVDAGAWSLPAASSPRPGDAANRASAASGDDGAARARRRAAWRPDAPRRWPGCGAASVRRRPRPARPFRAGDHTFTADSRRTPRTSRRRTQLARVAALLACCPPGPPEALKVDHQFVARDADRVGHHQSIVARSHSPSMPGPHARPETRRLRWADGRHQARLQHRLLVVGTAQRRARRRQEAEQLGFNSVWTAEAYGSDALTPLAWWGASTETLKLGTAIMQMSARTPAAAAMAAITMDHLSNGRFILGLGASGPQVVEGWYGQPYPKPLARTREYVEIVRSIVAREQPVEFHGEFYDMPFEGGAGPRQGAQVDGAPAAYRHPDLPRRRGPEERGAGGRDLRRLAAAVLLTEGGRLLPRLPPARASTPRATRPRRTASRSPRP